MGLDMYLISKAKDGQETEIGYWRKANAVHKWFVDNVQNGVDDCGEYLVGTEKLNELLSICTVIVGESVLERSMVKNGESLIGGVWVPIMEDGETIVNPSVAERLLPTAKGFFFGSSDYDQWYMNGIKNTIEIINKALKSEGEIHYSSSW